MKSTPTKVNTKECHSAVESWGFFTEFVLNKAIPEKLKTVARTPLPDREITGIHGNINLFSDIPSRPI